MSTVRDEWLTDNIIGFWQEWLEHEELINHPRVKVILLRPPMAFMLMQTPDVTTIQTALPDMSKATHVFLPINDNRDVTAAEGGSHWSLLLVSIRDGLAFHYDSMRGNNAQEGEKATRRLSQLLGLNSPLQFVNLEKTPQQANSNDCGVFVCLLMKHLLLEKLLKNHHGQKVDMSVDHKSINAAQGRKRLKELIDEKREDYLRERQLYVCTPTFTSPAYKVLGIYQSGLQAGAGVEHGTILRHRTIRNGAAQMVGCGGGHE